MTKSFIDIRHHLLAGFKAKTLSLLIQTLNFLIIARTLGGKQLSNFLLFSVLVGLIASVTNAWSSAFQNELTDTNETLFKQCFSKLVAYLTLTCILLTILLATAATLTHHSFDSFSILSSHIWTHSLILFAGSFFGSLTYIQIAFFSSKGESIKLGKQQLLGRICAFAILTSYFLISLEPSGVLTTLILSLSNALPFLPHLTKNLCKTSLYLKKGTVIKYIKFSVINGLSSSIAFFEINIIAQLNSHNLTNAYGICQRLLNPISSIVATGCRNLWPLLRNDLRKHIVDFSIKSKQIKTMAFLTAIIAGIAIILGESMLKGLFSFEGEFAVTIIAVACSRHFYLSATSPSYNYFASQNKELKTIYILATLAVSTVILYAIKRPDLAIIIIPFSYALSTILCSTIEFREIKRILYSNIK